MYNLCVDLPRRLCAEEPFTRIVTARSAGCSQAILDVGHAHMLTDLDYMRIATQCTQQGVGACFTPISVCEFYITAYFTGPKKQRREMDATAFCLTTSQKRPNNLDSLLIVTSQHR